MVKVVSEIGKDQRVFDLYHVDALTAHACNLVGAVTLKQRSHELWRLEHALSHSASSHIARRDCICTTPQTLQNTTTFYLTRTNTHFIIIGGGYQVSKDSGLT